MNFTSETVENVTSIKMLTSHATYGIGLFTAIATSFEMLFGAKCNMFDDKIEKAKNEAAKELIKKAEKAGATGIMDVRIQIFGLTVFMTGIAYK